MTTKQLLEKVGGVYEYEVDGDKRRWRLLRPDEVDGEPFVDCECEYGGNWYHALNWFDADLDALLSLHEREIGAEVLREALQEMVNAQTVAQFSIAKKKAAALLSPTKQEVQS